MAAIQITEDDMKSYAVKKEKQQEELRKTAEAIIENVTHNLKAFADHKETLRKNSVEKGYSYDAEKIDKSIQDQQLHLICQMLRQYRDFVIDSL